MTNAELLDNPIWHALSTDQASIALGDHLARRYPQEIGPLAGIPDQSEDCYAALRELAGDGVVALFSVDAFRLPPAWKVLREGSIVQMIRAATTGGDPGSRFGDVGSGVERPAQVRRLTPADAPAMVALAELTEPGPFRLRTIELGNFYGICHGDQLVAMAGKRMHLPGLVEVSGVCTHPDARGRGYARQLMSIVIDEIEREGKRAFLHALADNPAIRLYEQLGFAVRQNFELRVIAGAK